MLGHKYRFKTQFINCIQNKSQKKLSKLSYKDLFLLLKSTSNDSKKNESEKLYLSAKLAIILAYYEYFDENKDSDISEIDNNVGYNIWKAYSFLFQNKVNHCSNLLDSIKNKVNKSDKLIFADYYLTRFIFLYFKGEYNVIISEFEAIKDIINELKTDASFSKLGIYFYASYTYYIMKQQDKALELINNVINTNQEEIDKFFYAKLISLIGNISISKGEFIKSKELFRKSYDLSKTLEDHNGMISRLLDLGILEYKINNYSESVRYLIKARDKAIAFNLKVSIPKCHSNLGNSYLMLGKLEKARREFEKALSIYLQENNFISAIAIYNNLGIMFADKGYFNKSEDYYSKATEFSEKYEDNSNTILIYNNLGLLHQKRGSYLKSLEIFESIYDKILNEDIDDASLITKIALNLAETYRLQGYLKKSIDIITKTINIVEKSNNHLLEALMHDRNARINYDLGNVPVAKKEIFKTLELFESLNNPMDISRTKQLIGRIFLVENKIEKALKIMSEAYDELFNKKLFSFAYQSLIINIADIYTNQGNFKESRKWLKKLLFNSNRITISEEIKAQKQMIEITERFSKNLISIEELDDFEKILINKQYFNIFLKLKLLKIRYCIQKNETKKALNLISDGLQIATDKKLNILKIEMNLLKSIILARNFEYDNAIANCEEMNEVLLTNKLYYYINKQKETINLIIKSKNDLDSLYDMVESKSKEKEIKIKNNMIISLETILSYVDSTIRTIRLDSSV